MEKDLKDPASVMFFAYVVYAYNIYVLIKEMASHWPSMKENMGQNRVEKGNNIYLQLTNSTKAQGLIVHHV